MSGKLVVITGATRGLGRALVEKLIEAGCTVAGCGTTAKSVQELSSIFTEHSFQMYF